MKHYFLCVIEWQSGTESRWVEILESDMTPVEALLCMESRMKAQYKFQTGKLIVLPITKDGAEFVEEKPSHYVPCVGRRICKC